MSYSVHYRELPVMAAQYAKARKTPQGTWIYEHKNLGNKVRAILDAFVKYDQQGSTDRLRFAKRLSKNPDFMAKFGGWTPEIINTECIEALARFGVFPKKDSVTPLLMKIRVQWESSYNRFRRGEAEEVDEATATADAEDDVASQEAWAASAVVARAVSGDEQEREYQQLLQEEESAKAQTIVPSTQEESESPLVAALTVVIVELRKEHAEVSQSHDIKIRLAASHKNWEDLVNIEKALWVESEACDQERMVSVQENVALVHSYPTREQLAAANDALFIIRDKKIAIMEKIAVVKAEISRASEEVIALEEGVKVGMQNHAEKMQILQRDIETLEAARLVLQCRPDVLQDLGLAMVPQAVETSSGGAFEFPSDWREKINKTKLSVLFGEQADVDAITKFVNARGGGTAELLEAALNGDKDVAKAPSSVVAALKTFFQRHSDEQGVFSPVKLHQAMQKWCAQTMRSLVEV